MRALIGLLIFGGIFLAAARWQKNRTRTAWTARELQHGLVNSPSSSEWSLLVLGAPSGAEPIPGAEPPPPPHQEPAWSELTVEDQTDAPSYSPDYRYIIQKGDVLGQICRQHYGTARMALVAAVARYNNLASPDAVRIGDAVLLPDRAQLGE